MNADGPVAEYDCAGCGWHVYDVGRVEPPASRLCAVCGWAAEFITDPEAHAAFMLRERPPPCDT